MMSAVVLETCWGDTVICILQSKKLGASSWSQKLIYIMMHGQRNIKTVLVFFVLSHNKHRLFPCTYSIQWLLQETVLRYLLCEDWVFTSNLGNRKSLKS
jgi:hypothetical protein